MGFFWPTYNASQGSSMEKEDSEEASGHTEIQSFPSKFIVLVIYIFIDFIEKF